MSDVCEPTVAEFRAVPAGAVTITVMGGAVTMSIVGRVQSTSGDPLQVQPSPVADTRVAPAGSVSLTVTLTACERPALATVSV